MSEMDDAFQFMTALKKIEEWGGSLPIHNLLVKERMQSQITKKIGYELAKSEEGKARMLLLGRLRIREGDIIPLPHISFFFAEGKAIVFIVNKDHKPVVIEDDPDLFPSDMLVTQLRLLIG